jgi:hypothetical protein
MTEQLTGQELISEIINFHNATLPQFEVKWQTALENVGLLYNKHWSNDAEAKHKLQDRIALNFPYLFSKIQAILGYEKHNRNDISIEGENKEDELNGEIANQFLKVLFAKNDYEYIKDEIFEDGCVPSYGVIEIDIETGLDGKEDICFKRIPYNELLWDLNFTDYDRHTASREQRFEWRYLDDLIIEFPEAKDKLLEYTNMSMAYDTNNSRFRQLQDYYSHPKGFATEGDDLKWIVKVIHDYKKINKTVYELHDLSRQTVDILETKKDAKAEQAKRMLQVKNEVAQQHKIATLQSVQNGLPLPQEPVINEAEIFTIKPVTQKRIAYTACTLNTIIQDTEILDDDEFRHVVYFCLFKDGEWWTLADIGKDTQQYMDKLWSQIDYDIGTDVKGAKQMNTTVIDTAKQSIEEAETALSEGRLIFTTTNEEAIRMVKRSGTNPQYMNLSKELTMLMEQIYGGANFQGNQESSGESGIAIERRQEAGGVLALNYLKNLNRFDLNFGRRVVQFMQRHYDQETMFKVLGSAFTEEVMQMLQDNGMYEKSATNPSSGYVVVNKDGHQPLGDSDLIVHVTTQNAKLNDDQYKIQQMGAYQQLTQLPLPEDMVADKLGFNPTEKQKLIKKADEFRQQQAQMQQLQMAQAQAQMQMQQQAQTADNMHKTATTLLDVHNALKPEPVKESNGKAKK